MNRLALPVLAVFAALMVYAGADLPPVGDPEAPASVHVGGQYVARALPDTRTPNVVTAVLVDYRGFDTLGEAVVVLTAVLACSLILARARRPEEHG